MSIPRVEPMGVTVHRLAHHPARGEAHVEPGALSRRHVAQHRAPSLLVRLRLHRIDDDLQAPVLGGPGELLLGGVALAQGHGHELADLAGRDGEAVQPGLPGHDDVVL